MSDLIVPVSPFRPQCTHYTGRSRCENPADFWIVTPEGSLGSPYCVDHSIATVSEYAEKLGEEWSMEPVKVLYE